MQDKEYNVTQCSFDATNEMLRKAYQLAGRPRLRGLIQQAVLPQRLSYSGFHMDVVPSDNFTEFTIWRTGRSPEERELDWLVQIFHGQDLKVLDIGAKAGLYSLVLASTLSTGSEIHAFEPNPVMANRLLRNCKINDFNNVVLHRFALSSQEGEAQLSFVERGDFATDLGQGSLLDPEVTSGHRSITVATKPLADLTFATEADFCKMDIEGYEADVLEDYFEPVPIADLPRYLQLETAHAHTWNTDIRPTLKKLGYVAEFETKKNTIFKIR